MIAGLSPLQKKSTKLNLSPKMEVSRMSWKRIEAISRAATTFLDGVKVIMKLHSILYSVHCTEVENFDFLSSGGLASLC